MSGLSPKEAVERLYELLTAGYYDEAKALLAPDYHSHTQPHEVSPDALIAEIESVKAVSDLIAPVTGEVVESNEELSDNLEWLSEEPFGKAWMIKVKVTDTSGDLMDGVAYDAHCQAEG